MGRTSILAGMRWLCAFLAVAASLAPALVCAQDLAPRAYVITPQGTNAVVVSWSLLMGGLNLNGTVPLKDSTGTFSTPAISYYRSLGFLGRSANITVYLPYGIGTFQGAKLDGTGVETYRSGLLDSGVRFSVNFKGGPAMPLPRFAKWKQKVLLGASLRVIAPTGQYDPTKLINWGINRWAFKPEFGYSQRWGKWILDGYAGAWFFTANHQSFSLPTPKKQTLSPVASFEGHFSRDVKQRLWFSLDGNFWIGGTASVEGTPNPDTRQTSSRIGGTASIPLNKRQSIKVSYSAGAFSRFGGDYQNLSFAWQYAWLSKR